jgi:WD40 repeat protein
LGELKLWDVREGKEKADLKGHSSYVISISFSPDGKSLASVSWDKTIKLWDLSSGKIIASIGGHPSPLNVVTFSPDGKLLASGSWDGTIRLWEIPAAGKTDK